ncbi:MAG: biotin/lipoate--protein ligase family protein [Methyloligellaceae bacterium]
MHMPDPTFPPMLKGHDVRGEAPFEVACARVAAGALGAGDVVWSRNTSRIELAIVLEPDVPLERAVQMMPLALVAAGDCIGALTPPQVGVTFTWPDVVRINGAAAGLFRAGLGGAEGPETVPDWLVIGLDLRHLREPGDPEPGHAPDITWLGEEGGGEITRSQFIESYCRHFLTWINTWNDDGFRPVHDAWLFRSQARDEEGAPPSSDPDVAGEFLGLDDNGNLLLKRPDGTTEALLLADRFERHSARVAAP